MVTKTLCDGCGNDIGNDPVMCSGLRGPAWRADDPMPDLCSWKCAATWASKMQAKVDDAV